MMLHVTNYARGGNTWLIILSCLMIRTQTRILHQINPYKIQKNKIKYVRPWHHTYHTVCIVSDGEAKRGDALVILTMSSQLSAGSPLYAQLFSLKLMNHLVSPDNITADKDFKHIFKRWYAPGSSGRWKRVFCSFQVVLVHPGTPASSQTISFSWTLVQHFRTCSALLRVPALLWPSCAYSRPHYRPHPLL